MERTTEAQAIAELANPVKGLIRGELAAVNNEYKVVDLERFQDGRNRARGVLNTPSFEDFKTYVLAGSTPDPAPVFVDHKNVSATALLNYFQPNFAQGHCDHTAVLKLEPTVVWNKLNQLKDTKLSQKRFAIFLEDWAGVLVATTDSGEIISIGEALNAVRNMQIDKSITNGNQVNNMSESNSKLERVEASATVGKLPSYFEIQDTAYVGLEEKTIKLRLVVNSSGSEPELALQIVKEELLCNEIIQEFKEKVIELLPENPVRIGTFAA